jgi:hypothetical protein
VVVDKAYRKTTSTETPVVDASSEKWGKQSASVTILVTANPDVAGTLVNTAVVSGEQAETDLSNNRSTVSTPVGSRVIPHSTPRLSKRLFLGR